MPNVVDIIQSVQVPQLIKDEYISQGKPMLDGRSRPVHFTGGFAVVFPFIVNGNKWAFRCWSADIGNVERRLHSLSSELKQLRLPYFCDFSYEPIGIIINGEAYPTTRMQWIDGKTIKDYICENKDDTVRMQKLADDFLHMCETLHQYKIAHGDLQHGNILVDENGSLYLIDYDSVYLPALKGETDIISGLPDYQHPKRKENKISSEKLDYFSELVIYLSIRAIAENPALVNKYQVVDADRLLFAKEDYENIRQSQVYRDIFSLGEDFKDLLEVLDGYLNEDDINDLWPFPEVLLMNKIIFTTSAEKAIRNRQTVVLNWLVPFEAMVVLSKSKSDFVQTCEPKGRYVTTLRGDAEFILKAKTSNGQQVEKTVSIRVFDECSIDFKADKYYIYPTIPVVLSWKVTNAKQIILDGELVEAEGRKVIEPKKATSSILQAEDEFGIKEKRIDIQMLPVPQVKTLLVPAPKITNNMSICIKQPRQSAEVRFPAIHIDWIKAEVPKVPSLTDLGINVELSPPLPKFSLRKTIKKVFNHITKR